MHAHAWHILQVWHYEWPHLEMASGWTLSSILHAPTFCIHVHQSILHNDVRLTTTLNDLLMSTPGLLKGHYMVHAFSTATKLTEVGHTLSCCISWNRSSAFCPCPHFTCSNIIVFQVTTFQDGILLNTCQAASVLQHFAYISNKLFPTKIWDHFEWSVHEQVCSFLSDSEPAHALITGAKVNLSGHISPHCICRKCCTAFSDCPSFTYFVSFLFHAKMLNCAVPGAIAVIFAAIHSGFHISSSQSASHVFLCLKSRYLSFVYNQKSRLSWSAMYSPHPTPQKYHQNRKSCTEILSISKRILSEHIAIYLPSPDY